ncbi:MAG: preprotein translocase subunit YajC [Succinivibrionaceae bacterium]
MDFISVAYADETAAQVGQQTGGLASMLIMIVIFIVLMYVITIRPNKKAAKQKQEMMSKIGNGDEVMLRSGICGVIKTIKADSPYVVIEISNGVPVTYDKDAIIHILPKGTISSMKQ